MLANNLRAGRRIKIGVQPVYSIPATQKASQNLQPNALKPFARKYRKIGKIGDTVFIQIRL